MIPLRATGGEFAFELPVYTVVAKARLIAPGVPHSLSFQRASADAVMTLLTDEDLAAKWLVASGSPGQSILRVDDGDLLLMCVLYAYFQGVKYVAFDPTDPRRGPDAGVYNPIAEVVSALRGAAR